MKKITLSFLALALGLAGFSQVQFGIKAGVNLADIKDDAAEDNTDTRVGYHFGALAHIHLSPKFAVQPEAVYSSQGAKYTLSSYNGVSKLGYVNIPVLVQYMAGSGLRLETGPQLGLLVNADFEPADGTPELDIRDRTEKAEFAWVAGIGYLTPLGIGIDARFHYGISNVNSEPRPDAKNRIWQFGLFYQFNRMAKK